MFLNVLDLSLERKFNRNFKHLNCIHLDHTQIERHSKSNVRQQQWQHEFALAF